MSNKPSKTERFNQAFKNLYPLSAEQLVYKLSPKRGWYLMPRAAYLGKNVGAATVAITLLLGPSTQLKPSVTKPSISGRIAGFMPPDER